MPARKPSVLITRDETKADREKRTESEDALTPTRPLPKVEPPELRGHALAAATWRELMRTYNSADGTIVTQFDRRLLLNYCVLTEQLAELDELRHGAMVDWQANQEALKLLREQIADKGEAIAPDLLIKAMQAVNFARDLIIKLDGRADRKRALLLTLSQSLYLTPRSRAGVAPPEKPPEEPDDPMGKLLDGPPGKNK